jgi:hypothetical protein
MRKLLRARRLPAILLAVLALVIAGGAGALAAGRGGSSTITVCVHKHGGTLYRRAGTCHRNDKQLSWNKQGPQGRPGPQGSQGPEGPQGPDGPGATVSATHAFSAALGSEVTLGVGTPVLSMTLPAGSYVLSASVTVVNVDPTPANEGLASCAFDELDSEGRSTEGQADVPGGAQRSSISVDEAIIHGGGTLTLKCTGPGTALRAFEAYFTATSVDSIG